MRLGGVWRKPDFVKLWVGETVSLFGSQITQLALPLTAIQWFDASPAGMGALATARFLPFLVLTLVAGVWVDRVRRRPVMLVANVGRALVLGLIPTGALMGWLRFEHLVAVAAVTGALAVLFDLSYQSYVPGLVRRDELVEANAKLQTSASAAEVGGPALGGLLVQWLGAPGAIAADAASFLISAVTLAAIRHPEPSPTAGSARERLVHQIGQGVHLVVQNRYLRGLAGEAATYNLFEAAVLAIFALYATRELGLSPGELGAVMSMGAAGALAGAVIASAAARAVGFGPALVGAMALACCPLILIPLAGGPRPVVLGLLAAAFFLNGVGLAVSNVHVVSLRQAITPADLLGRMNAAYRFFVYGAIPLGSMLGGLLGESLGVRRALLVAAVGLWTALLWVVRSPVAGLADLPRAGEDTSSAR